MRTAPAVAVEVSPGGAGRAALGVLAGSSLAATVVWAAQRGDTLGWSALAAVAAGAGVVMRQAMRRPAMRLRWDGQAWHLGPAGEADEAVAGQIAVALDLGNWMLLRFCPEPAVGARRLWLPLQRAGLESQWHALRCAVHSPRAAAGRAGSAAPGS